ncbi:MAG: RluA family pseudouridine synthase [Pseudomonadota bacterium]
MSDLIVIEVEIADAPPPRLDKALARDVPEAANLSRSHLVRLIEAGAVSLDGQVVGSVKTKAQPGQIWQIAVPPPETLEARPEAIALDIVYEDDCLIVVNKPVGMVVHPAPGTPSGTLVNALLHHCADSLSGIGGVMRPGIVHRIDKDTSGLLVVAKSDAAHHGLARQFEKHSVERHYTALCYGAPDAADPRLAGMAGIGFEPRNILRVTAPLARHKTDRQRQAVVKSGGRHAVTRARRLEVFGTPPAASLMECWLETGRTHQIRVHMAYAGHALLGDPVYGGTRKLAKSSLSESAQKAISSFPRQALHAATLGFKHPETGEVLRFIAPLPQDMEQLLADLKC